MSLDSCALPMVCCDSIALAAQASTPGCWLSSDDATVELKVQQQCGNAAALQAAQQHLQPGACQALSQSRIKLNLYQAARQHLQPGACKALGQGIAGRAGVQHQAPHAIRVLAQQVRLRQAGAACRHRGHEDTSESASQVNRAVLIMFIVLALNSRVTLCWP